MPSRISKVIETLFRVYDKEGELVDFKLNEIQRRFDEEIIKPIEDARDAGLDPLEMYNYVRNSVLKYRQGGISTLVLAWFLVECMNGYACVVMLTQDKAHSEKLLYRARIMLKNLKGPKPVTSKLNDNEIAFQKTDALFYIGTAGSKEFGRSATITHLHCSEIAFWQDPARLMKSLFQAVPRSGVIVQETTANGWGTWFQKSYYKYLAGQGGFNARFYPWYIHEDYVSMTPWSGKEDAFCHSDWMTERWTLYRCMRRAEPSLTKSQLCAKLQWRREKIAENLGDQGFENALKGFQQEYPHTYQEAFTMSGGMLFADLQHSSNDNWQDTEPYTQEDITHPKAGLSYSLGADFAGGTGNDNSAIVVQCVDTKEQVYRYANKFINPVDFAIKIDEVGKKYNLAYLVPEYNNHGIAGVAMLKKLYPLQKIYKHQLPKGAITSAQTNVPSYGYGWKTSATTKPYMVGVGVQFALAGYKVYDAMTFDELKAFAEDPDTGKIEGRGDHDDCGMAWILSCLGVLKVMRVSTIDPTEMHEHTRETSLEAIHQEPEEPKQPKHRDSDGRFLVGFEDMFTRKGDWNKRSSRHHSVRANG